MNRQQIIAEIQRIAIDGNDAPGQQAFERATGIRKSDWYPHIWLRWGDAVTEAGYAPNEFTTRISDEVLIENYVGLAESWVGSRLRARFAASRRPTVPSRTKKRSRFGGKLGLLAAVAAYCRKTSGFEDIAALWVQQESASRQSPPEKRREAKVATGFVYLMKSGPHYKIGRTNSVGRRESELAIKIPVPPTTFHNIETDEPVGVEAYWHRRFADKRGEGEWFALSLEEVRAFKRWKRIT